MEVRRRVVPVLLIVLALFVLLLGLIWFFQRSLIYFPGSAAGAASGVRQVLPEARDVTLSTEDGLSLAASFLPPRDRDGIVVLVANGNGGGRELRAPLARALAGRGLGVLLFDYRGYGGNPGTPTEKGLAYDVRAARQALVDDLGVAPQRLVYFGESLGTGVITGLAAEQPPAGLVLRSPFVDLASVGHRHYPYLPVRTLLRDRYPVAQQLRGIRVPVTVVYGGADSLIPPAESRAVAAAALNLRKLVEVPGADHNDAALLDGTDLIDAIVDMAELVQAETS